MSPRRRVSRWLLGSGLRVALALAIAVPAATAGVAVRAYAPQPHGRLAEAAVRAGDSRLAIRHLTVALRDDPEAKGLRRARARAQLRLGEFDLARADFEAVGERILDGPDLACWAYCLNQLGQHRKAIPLYEAAVAAGFDPAEVFNNLGVSYYRTAHEEKDFVRARTNLGAALERNASLQAAYYNRALLARGDAVSNHQVPDGGILDIERALALGPPTADLHLTAARLYGVAADLTAGTKQQWWQDKALAALTHAVELGHDPHALAGDTSVKNLRADPRFRALVQQPRRTGVHRPPPRWLLPCPDLAP
jgi:tetratricopeptide (TPR) repeat protein